MGNSFQDENFKQSLVSLITSEGDGIVKKVKTGDCSYQFIQPETFMEQDVDTTDEMSQYLTSLDDVKVMLEKALPFTKPSRVLIRCQLIAIQSDNSIYKSCEYCNKKVNVRKQIAYCGHCKQTVQYQIKFRWLAKVKQNDTELDVVIFQQDLLPVTGEEWNLYPDHIRKDFIDKELKKQQTYQMHAEISAKLFKENTYRQVKINKFTII